MSRDAGGSTAACNAVVFDVIRQHLAARYSGDFHRTVAVREFLEQACRRHLDLSLGDADLHQKLCSAGEHQYWQQLSEILIGHELLEAELSLIPSRNGPDFLVEHDGGKIWIEVTCPQPEGIPSEWLAQPTGQVHSLPHEAILLRWTAAIKEKAQKLLGNPMSEAMGYIEKNIVAENDVYVIAINARLLRGPHFASITGISQLPFAAEAVFAIGPYAVTIDLRTLAACGGGHTHRPTIRKPNGADVPAYTFLDPAFRPVSAIWAVDIDETWVIGNSKPMAIIHNPIASSPLPIGLLPCQEEYVAVPDGPDQYRLDRLAGRLNENPA